MRATGKHAASDAIFKIVRIGSVKSVNAKIRDVRIVFNDVRRGSNREVSSSFGIFSCPLGDRGRVVSSGKLIVDRDVELCSIIRPDFRRAGRVD